MFISAFSSPTSTPKWPIKELLVLCRQPATRLLPPLSTAETSQLQVATSVRIRGAVGQQKELMVSAASLRGTPFCSGHPWGSRVAQGAVGRASMSSAFVTLALVITRYNWLSIASYLSRSLTKQKTTLAVASCTCLISPQSCAAFIKRIAGHHKPSTYTDLSVLSGIKLCSSSVDPLKDE
jgi:hypothetical protein